MGAQSSFKTSVYCSRYKYDFLYTKNSRKGLFLEKMQPEIYNSLKIIYSSWFYLEIIL